jgi:5'-3' exonuclease
MSEPQFMPEQPNFILIDGSYYVFFRYYAILSWFKLAKKDEVLEDPIENETFREKFKSTFVSKLKDISKKLKIKNPIMLVARDCPRENIWRMKHLPSYKANRVYDDTFLGGPFFKMAYNEELFIKGGAKMILKYPSLEADDCVAITAKNILTKFPKANITIITSDMDYLQLANSQITLYDLKFKKLTERKSSFNDAEKDLFVKIVTGDKSDNISSVFKKCGTKTACKYYDNKELFYKKLEQEEGAKEKYELNKKIIDFNMIPQDLIDGFKKKYNIS